MISLYSYRLPFKKPFITGHSTHTHREGVVLRYLDNSVDYWSEAAPLPGFSSETLADVTGFLTNRIEELNAFFTSDYTQYELQNKLQYWPKFPSLQFALSYLGIRILAYKKRRSPEAFLPFDIKTELKVNDVMGISDSEVLQKQVKASYDSGFRTIKIKVGRSPEKLARSLQNVAASCPGLQLRIDSNRSWPINQINEFSSYFSDLPVQYIEEPAVFSDLSKLSSILEASKCPVALDESIRGTEHLRNIRTENPNIFVVIKPAMIGNLLDIAETIRGFEGKRYRVVFSTLLESKIGREMTAFTAANLGDTELAHGLNTGKLFSEDLLTDFSVNHGVINLSKCIRENRKPIRFQHLTLLNGIHS